MSIGQTDLNKQTVEQFFDHLNASDPRAAYALFVDDATVWIPTDRQDRPVVEYVESVVAFFAAMLEPARFVIQEMTAEDDRVSIRCTSTTTLSNGKRYDQCYHFLFRVADGRLLQGWEYLDTHQVYTQLLNLDGFEHLPSTTSTSLDNGQLIKDVYARWSSGDKSLLSELMSEDVVLIVPGSTRFSGIHEGKHAIDDNVGRHVRASLAGPLSISADRIVADGDFVVVQARGRADTVSGGVYNNTYCHVFKFAEGKIVELTEYCDTELVTSALIRVD